MSLFRLSAMFRSGAQLLRAIGQPMVEQTRTNVRWRFEHPSEVKRIRKHGWMARIATKKGRVIIMRRILKNRHVLTH